MLGDLIAHTARRFARAIVMPNLAPPVTTVGQALAYRERILANAPRGMSFNPLMTLYLTDNTGADEIRRASDSEHVHAVKLYPAGATTLSEHGVTCLERVWPALEAMQALGLPLLVHGEVTDPAVDVFDREAVFIERHLVPLTERFPALKIVLEHVTTVEGVDFVTESSPNVAGTLTAHHLLINRNAMFDRGLRPHHYCLPVAKRERHRRALLVAATSENPKFFLGTDSAPHERAAKEAACACAGIFTAHGAIELYAEAFEQAGALERLERFASFNGPDFYGLPRNRDRLTLVRRRWVVPPTLALGPAHLVPFRAGEPIVWEIGGGSAGSTA